MADALLGGIVINEVLIDPNGVNNFDTDQNGRARGADEFIELYNTSTGAIDISGVELWDAGRDNWYTFPTGTVLQAGARVVVVRNVQNGGTLPSVTGDDIALDANFGQNVFNNAGDNIVVYDPTNDEFIQATYNNDTLDDPTSGPGYSGFSATATRVGSGEDFGTDNDGRSIQRAPDGTDDFVNDQVPTPGNDNICFAAGTRIRTEAGPVAIEDLAVGDLVLTQSHGLQPLRWIFSHTQSPERQRAKPNLRPIVIAAGALGHGLPKRDLRVSAQHRIAVSGKIAERMFGAVAVLVPAIHLLPLPGVWRDDSCAPVTYFHVMFERHEVIFANGAPAESLYLGEQAMIALSAAARAELVQLFPDLADGVPQSLTQRALPFAVGKRAKALIRRHVKNNRPLCAGDAGLCTAP
jgi:hypothetical protein